jgi:hypothetical protein
MNSRRRKYLATLAAVASAGIAGCSQSESNDDNPDRTSSKPSDTSSSTTSETTTETNTEDAESTTTQANQQVAKLTPGVAEDIQSIGLASGLSADGTTAAISGFEESYAAVWVFEQTNDGWSPQAKLAGDRSHDPEQTWPWFGVPVYLSNDGDRIFVGASYENEGNGAVYVFERSGSSWSQTHKFSGESGDELGYSLGVSKSGETALISARADEDPGNNRTGSVYAYTEVDGSWTRQAKLTTNDPDRDHIFGEHVELSNDGTSAIIHAVSEPNEEDGVLYHYAQTEDGWRQQAELLVDRDRSGGDIGFSGDGSTVMLEDGGILVLERSGGDWSEHRFRVNDLIEDAANVSGHQIILSEDSSRALLTAPTAETSAGDNAGTAYLLKNTSDGWSDQATLKPDDAAEGHWFGWSASLSTDATTAVVSRRMLRGNGPVAGASYIFQ